MRNSEMLAGSDSGKGKNTAADGEFNNMATALFDMVAAAGKNTWQTFKSGDSTIRLEKDFLGKNVSRVCTGSDGYRVVDKFDRNEKLTELTIVEPSGATVSLHKNLVGSDTTIWQGRRKDSHGKALDEVSWRDGFLYYTDLTSFTLKGAAKFQHAKDVKAAPHLTKGSYDPDRASFKYENALGQQVTQYLASERVDAINPQKGWLLSGPTGALRADGLAVVSHGPGKGVSMDKDNHINFWDTTTNTVRQDGLTTGEKAFLTAHSSIVDRRDFAEIHSRFSNNVPELDNFYNNLSRFDSVPTFSASRKAAIETELMHQVAFPSEICQGLTGTCNVSQIEREMALDQPAMLAATIYDEVVVGKVKGASGTTFQLDRLNLQIDDTSERDLVSRIFQTAALQIAFSKQGLMLRNSIAGVPIVLDSKGQFNDYTGVNLADTADVGYELTGLAHSVVRVKSLDDLYSAFNAGGKRAMIASVDGNMYPIVPMTEGDKAGRHDVTITDVKPLADAKYKVGFQNQWELKYDHSKPDTMVDGDAFLKNLLAGVGDNDKRILREYGRVVVRGLTQGTAYNIEDGKLSPI